MCIDECDTRFHQLEHIPSVNRAQIHPIGSQKGMSSPKFNPKNEYQQSPFRRCCTPAGRSHDNNNNNNHLQVTAINILEFAGID